MDTMEANTTPTQANRGMLPVGTVVEGFGRIAQVSLTAYRFEGQPLACEWVSFTRVHGEPRFVTPLVTFEGEAY